MQLLNLLFLSGIGFAELLILMLFFFLPIIFLPIIALWKIFEKAGEPGWAAIIPVYNLIIIMKIADKPWWWGLLACIPYVGLVFSIWGTNLMVKKFGKTEAFTVGIVFLPFIFLPILGFGDARFSRN